MSATRDSSLDVAVDRSVTGFVADTISFSNVDGPGNRFVVFLQGCNFDCVACHNPQTIPGHQPLDGIPPAPPQRRRPARPDPPGGTVHPGHHRLGRRSDAAARRSCTRCSPPSSPHPTWRDLTCFVDSNGATGSTCGTTWRP